MSIELKIKAKHLAVESKIIRHEENKLKNWIRSQSPRPNDPYKDKDVETLFSLTSHRTYVVRTEARATNLARAYIKGTPYKKVERKCKDPGYLFFYVTPRILSMVQKYHDRKTTVDDIRNWYTGKVNETESKVA